MTDLNQPYYPQYPGDQPDPNRPPNPGGLQPPPPPPPRGPTISVSLGERGNRRPEPRLGTALAGAGIALAIVGVLLWSFTYLIQGVVESFDDDGGGPADAGSRRFLGVGLSLAVVAIGYFLAIRWKKGPLATAGVAASAIGVPVALVFLSFSLTSSTPISIDAVVIVSILIWLISYLFVPGTKGHTFYLGLSALDLWGYLLDKSEPNAVSGLALRSVTDEFGTTGALGNSSPSPATVAAISLIFGLGYYAIALLLDRKGRSGPAIAFVVSGLIATAVGVGAASDDLKQIGTGVLLVVLGLVIATFAVRSARRFTTWIWSAAVALGLGLVIAKLAGDDHLALAGALFIVAGFGLVAAGYALTNALNEPDEFAAVAEVTPAVH
jgi:hypothetical protein